MQQITCEQCGQRWPVDEMLKREDNGQLVCLECSGLLADEGSGCRYDETG